MAIHIGEIIKLEAEKQRYSQEALAQKINTTKQNVGDIYKRRTIDTGLLLDICVSLEHDFFEYYHNEEPLKSMRNNEIAQLKEQIEFLKSSISQQENYIEKQDLLIERQEEVISSLKEKIEESKKG